MYFCRFFKYLRNVSVEGDQGKPNVEFTADGDLKAAELKIMNLRPGVSKQLVWEEVSDQIKHIIICLQLIICIKIYFELNKRHFDIIYILYKSL